MSLNVLLVDDQQLVRAGLRMLCDSAPDIEVVGEAADGIEAIELAASTTPDVVVMDLRMPRLDGISATSRIRADQPAIRVLVLTTFDDDDHLYAALAAGACGFLAKDAAPAELLDALHRAARGESPFSPPVLRRVVERALGARKAAAPGELPSVTDREQAVWELLAAGWSNAAIGAHLHMGVTTVKTHVASLMTKTGCDNRVRLAVLAVRHGIVADDR
ncbi:LuxR family two component transcriptional regulator [Tamaricihabitans halophyticus]|uniref:LuxR family two component transcriptional regulator n=1 Tax=Tamaricihabitans halophyticus TaxID=1262583 RepID=A0A4R2QKH3_9PSEU|nr:response regulator transcription factor [Tamaricihabitans halophyticus]TCP49349.1 LuxR family two component transcriptional regulator [Tamaricihabitans halophyticus]